MGSASRLGLRSFSRRDSVSDCIQFSLGDVFKSLKIRESPPGFKTARRKRCIRRSPRVLGGKGEGAGVGKRRGRGLGSTAVPEVISSLDQDLLWSGATESLGTWQLLPPTSSRQRLAGRGEVCKAMLHSWEASESKRRGDLGTGLPGGPAVPCVFLRCPYVPPLGLPFSHLLQELRPSLRVSARPCAGVYGRG